MKTFLLTSKKAYGLLELLFSTVIGVIIIFSSFGILKTIQKKDQITFDQTLTKIDFETTRLFLEHKIKTDATLSNLTLNNKRLLYNNDPLMDNVTDFSKSIEPNGIMIHICSDLNGELCTNFYLK